LVMSETKCEACGCALDPLRFTVECDGVAAEICLECGRKRLDDVESYNGHDVIAERIRANRAAAQHPETDAALRKRVLRSCIVSGLSPSVLDCASGAELDAMAERFGLKRGGASKEEPESPFPAVAINGERLRFNPGQRKVSWSVSENGTLSVEVSGARYEDEFFRRLQSWCINRESTRVEIHTENDIVCGNGRIGSLSSDGELEWEGVDWRIKPAVTEVGEAPKSMGIPTCGNCGKPVPADGTCARCGGKSATLADFQTAIGKHLLPLLPGRFGVVCDAVKGGFACWLLNADGSEVLDANERAVNFIQMGDHPMLDGDEGERWAAMVAAEMMKREARG